MRLTVIIAISLAIAGSALAQDHSRYNNLDTIYRVKALTKKYNRTKKDCIHMDTVLTTMKKTQEDQLTIIDRLKAIKEQQTTVQGASSPR